MPDLIIGPTTRSTARIWVRGEQGLETCVVTVRAGATTAVRSVELREASDYTGAVDFEDLEPQTEHAVVATFSPWHEVGGRFRTFSEDREEMPVRFSFVLSSCNLSVVSINNLLAFLLAKAGAAAAITSLDIPFERWSFPTWQWLRRLLRPVLKMVLSLVAGFIQRATDLKQPGPPYIRSPFLKLSAVFDSRLLTLEGAGPAPPVGARVRAAGATGVVASSKAIVRDRACGDRDVWQLVVTQVEGTFAESTTLTSDDRRTAIARIICVETGRRWYGSPSFFIHAGDQIYYDFPHEDRAPDRAQYRLAYREAWFDDQANRHLLSHWPHYMTLDDHDIADQFACDFVPPSPTATADTYLRESAVAYREYVQSRNPSTPSGVAGASATGPFWYRFDKGAARFFVLDTRTQRVDHLTHRRDGNDPGRIIDDEQMEQLLEWMSKYRDDLKFVVTSVPFVAQINDDASEKAVRWQGQSPELNPANDKWSAPRFRGQRERIIDHIACKGIEHLVFLTGDMHCCYHATMRIGAGEKYDCITVHELAGGPANQLQLAKIDEFDIIHNGQTLKHQVPYEIALDSFHSEVNAVLHLTVHYPLRPQVLHSDQPFAPEVEWNVIRTLTDNDASAWRHRTGPGAKVAMPDLEATMSGRISFVKRRQPENLLPW